MTHDVFTHLHLPDPPPSTTEKTLLPSPSTSPWANPDLDKRVIELWSYSSATQICGVISEEFGVHLSRSAVMGRISRLGLTCAINKERTKTVRKPRQTVLKVVVSNPEPFQCVELPSLNLAFGDLQAGDCRYPAGEDVASYTFCGHPALSKSSYCAFHHSITWVKPKPISRPAMRVWA